MNAEHHCQRRRTNPSVNLAAPGRCHRTERQKARRGTFSVRLTSTRRARLERGVGLAGYPAYLRSYDHDAEPPKLCGEVFARWTTNNFNETTSFFGFCAPGTTDAAAAGSAACIVANNSQLLPRRHRSSTVGRAVFCRHRFRYDNGERHNHWRSSRIEVVRHRRPNGSSMTVHRNDH